MANWKPSKYRNKKILASARGEDCDIKAPGCQNNTDTVVWCHSPFMEHGKGAGTKAHDIFGAYGCSHCHDILDGRAPEPLGWDRVDEFSKAKDRSLLKLLASGVIR